MTASPPWTPREAPPEPLYPLTDEDVLEEPMPVERFGPPPQARPSLFERVRDRIAVRRALSRSAGEFDDSVQIVSGSGAPLRTGRARAEVERRRQEAMQVHPAIPDEDAAEPGDEVDLGPMPPTAPFVAPGSTPHMPRPGQMAIPGTEEHPARQVMGSPVPPVRPSLPPLPPPRHSLESAIGAPPPLAPQPLRPPMAPPPAPVPDPLAEALQEYERGRPIRDAEPRPWRPREIPEDVVPAAAAAAAAPPAAAPERPPIADRPRHSPSQLRESRRLLALFGAAALVMLVVGIVSGRTSTPLPSSTNTAQSSNPAPAAQHPAVSQPAVKAPAPAPSSAAHPSSAPVAPAPPATTPQLTGAKVLGDSGSGYQVKDFRYGEHPNDFRIVLDMDAAGSASGTPKVTVGFVDSTTLDVVIEGTLAAGSTGALPAGSPVASVTLLQPSPFANAITYQLKLSHAMTFNAGYVTGPLRLVLDLAG